MKAEHVIEFCANHAWYRRHLKLLLKHRTYLERVCAGMQTDSEKEMNRVVLAIPYEERGGNKGCIVPELIQGFLSHFHQK